MGRILANRAELLVRIAKLYFLEGLTQGEIATEFGVSRSNVSRLLKACRDERIVEIRVREPTASAACLEQELVRRFALKGAVLVPFEPNQELRLAAVGRAAATLLDGVLRDGMILGVSWGQALLHTVASFHPERSRAVDVIQLMGGLGARDSESDGAQLALRLAERFSGRCYVLPAPLYVRAEETRRILTEEPDIRLVLDKAAKADVALVGVGTNVPRANALVRAGYLSEDQSAELLRQGVVGNILGRPLDVRGNVCPIELDRRVVAIEAEALRRIPLVVGVATGLEKCDALLGALRGRFVNTLVTDERTAAEILSRQQGS